MKKTPKASEKMPKTSEKTPKASENDNTGLVIKKIVRSPFGD